MEDEKSEVGSGNAAFDELRRAKWENERCAIEALRLLNTIFFKIDVKSRKIFAGRSAYVLTS
ncbi:hypothetical protein D1AOALGA4SA_11699 [Olavius algarvensis Delta 1 endosymbiont]|nr:hypothetical protein D1AOALGA4SA_11699 [Olavius algarvensis Delta 1 endosymbiont]